MKSLILVLKGFFMGIANVIPGVSGGTIALILGIYEKFISSISNLFKNLKENLRFLVPVAIGMVLAIVILSGAIEYSYDNFPLPTMLFFVGLVIGGIPMLVKNVLHKKESKRIGSYLIALITFSIVIFMACSSLIFTDLGDVSLTNMGILNYLLLFFVGVIAAATMVIPGISGSLVLMLLGYYYPIISTINSFVKFDNFWQNGLILVVFGLGVLVGIVVVAKILEMLFAKYKTKTYFGVLGFIFASVIAIPLSTYLELGTIPFSIQEVVVGILVLVAGFLISYKLGEK